MSAFIFATVTLINACYTFYMPFNHYAKIKRILDQQPEGWIIKQINQSTSATNFKGEKIAFPHYYRIYDHTGQPIKYCKFQQIERLAQVLKVPAELLPLINDGSPDHLNEHTPIAR